jgi:penicillin-binding protein 2
MGFAPMDNPKIAVSVYVENGGWGADLAAPLGGLIMEQYILGQLSPSSQKVAKKWENKEIYITPVEIPFNFDDL